MKNLNPRAIAFYISLVVAVAATLVVAATRTMQFSNWMSCFILFAAVLALSYFLFYYALETFIYRKIKLVYKTIHNLKLNRFTKDILGKSLRSEDPLTDVQVEVQQWAEDSHKEIEGLKKAEQYRKEFLSNLSHEFKTPLFSIQGYVHTLLDGAMEDGEVNRHFLEKTAGSIERLCNLVNDLEEIAKLESGEEQLDMVTFDMYSLTKDVFEEMEYKANTHGMHFTIKKGCERPFYVSADKDKVRQVMVNLLDNSIKYGNENGNTIVSFYDMAENILIEVTDDGIGISEEHLPRLFERFYRIDKSRSREQGGTGLGLAIVKHLIEAHGQTINVRSKVGVGSTFGFTLLKSVEN
ncbi:MAG: sensor histidine kinase [Chitinophagaceae bacterium]|nr:sensor histidine kinase [Chitinophagaceae bacterium]